MSYLLNFPNIVLEIKPGSEEDQCRQQGSYYHGNANSAINAICEKIGGERQGVGENEARIQATYITENKLYTDI